jgi:mannose-6-phosphate isomerase-like protein (cupin superfamily)
MHKLSTALLILAMNTGGSAQTPPPRSANAASTPSTLSVQVTDKSGNGIGNVAVALTGPVERSGTTGPDGSLAFRSMRAGTYRLRFQHDGFITLERELVLTRGAADVAVALNPAPPTVKPAAPVAAPVPAPVAPPAARTLKTVEPRAVAMVDFINRNFIGSEPQKLSLLACSDGGTARLLQVKEPLANLQDDTADQLLYVVAGGGVVRVKDQSYKAEAGSGLFVVIPRGAPHSIRREGRNPLIALVVAVGPSCTEAAPLAK